MIRMTWTLLRHRHQPALHSAVIGFVLMMAEMVFGALCWTWKMG